MNLKLPCDICNKQTLLIDLELISLLDVRVCQVCVDKLPLQSVYRDHTNTLNQFTDKQYKKFITVYEELAPKVFVDNEKSKYYE